MPRVCTKATLGDLLIQPYECYRCDGKITELREANQQFSRLVKAVKPGEEVRLTERGKPLAVVKWIERHGDAHAVVRRLETIGLICAASKCRALPVWSARPIRGVPVSRTVMKDRAER